MSLKSLFQKTAFLGGTGLKSNTVLGLSGFFQTRSTSTREFGTKDDKKLFSFFFYIEEYKYIFLYISTHTRISIQSIFLINKYIFFNIIVYIYSISNISSLLLFILKTLKVISMTRYISIFGLQGTFCRKYRD